MGILTISLDSLRLCEPVGGRKGTEESGVRQGVLEQRNSAGCPAYTGEHSHGISRRRLMMNHHTARPMRMRRMKRTREMETGRTGSETKRTSAEVPDAGRTDQSEKLTQVGRGRSGAGRREGGGRLGGRRVPLSTHRVGEGGALLHLHLSGFTP